MTGTWIGTHIGCNMQRASGPHNAGGDNRKNPMNVPEFVIRALKFYLRKDPDNWQRYLNNRRLWRMFEEILEREHDLCKQYQSGKGYSLDVLPHHHTESSDEEEEEDDDEEEEASPKPRPTKKARKTAAASKRDRRKSAPGSVDTSKTRRTQPSRAAKGSSSASAKRKRP